MVSVRPERKAEALAEQEKVDIRLHTIIYNLTDEIKRAMTGLLAPVFREVYKGKAEVRETFLLLFEACDNQEMVNDFRRQLTMLLY